MKTFAEVLSEIDEEYKAKHAINDRDIIPVTDQMREKAPTAPEGTELYGCKISYRITEKNHKTNTFDCVIDYFYKAK